MCISFARFYLSGYVRLVLALLLGLELCRGFYRQWATTLDDLQIEVEGHQGMRLRLKLN